MASPMNWFRKYQKVMLVVFGVLLMVVFLLPQLGSFNGPKVARPDDPVVVTWDGGSLRRSELDRLRVLHYQTVAFLGQIRAYASRKIGREVDPLINPISAIPEAASEERKDEEMLTRVLYAAEARKLGAEVSDEMVNDYIAWSGGEVELSEDELRQIVRDTSGGTFSFSQIREHLKLELACDQFQLMGSAGFPYLRDPMTGTTLTWNPVEAAQMYCRSAAEMECVVYPLPVADFLPRVETAPQEAELLTIYEQGRYMLPDPTMQEPGFKVPKKLDIQYVVAEFETFLTNEINKLTDAEVQAEYDRMVAAKDMRVMETVPAVESPLPGDPPATESPATDAPAAETPPAGDGQQTPSVAEPSAGSETPADPDGESSAPGSDGTGEAQPESPPATGEGSGDGSQTFPTAAAWSRPVMGWLAYTFAMMPPVVQDETKPEENPLREGTEQTPTAEPAATDAPANEQEPAGEQQSDVAPAEGAAAETEAAAGDPPAGNQDSAATPAAEPAANDAAASELLPPAQEPEPELRARPLKDVADVIKRSLKEQAAREAMEARLKAFEEILTEYQQDLMIWESLPEEDRDPKPVMPDFARLAADSGLLINSTGLVDEEAMKKLPIGNLSVVLGQFQSFPLPEVLFATFESLRPWAPRMVRAPNGDFWMCWMTEAKKVEVRDFKSAREDVVAFWKSRQARNMARADAENIVEEINSGGQPLNQKFGDKAANTGAFTWFATGFNQEGLGQPIGVTNPSDEFMRVASGLEIGKAGFATNLSGDIIYVIQKIAGDLRTTDELTESFVQQVATNQRLPFGVMLASAENVREMNFEFQDQFRKARKIEWIGR